jgi:hypothetical protein
VEEWFAAVLAKWHTDRQVCVGALYDSDLSTDGATWIVELQLKAQAERKDKGTARASAR